MKNNLNEGQTQVYMNGMVDSQFGVNTNAPHLNQPSKQLMDLTSQFFKSGKSQAQVLAILVGMGVQQQLAMTAIQWYCSQYGTPILKVEANRNPAGYPHQNGETKNFQLNAITEKNNTQMQFTLSNLYGKIEGTIDLINQIAEDKSRISYSANNAKKVLEGALSLFPELSISADTLKNMSESDIEKLKESKESKFDIIDAKVNPSLKYEIASKLFNQCGIYESIQPISELRSYIQSVYANDMWSFQVCEAANILSSRGNKLDDRLSTDLRGLLMESESIENDIISLAKKNPWSDITSTLANRVNESRRIGNQGKVKVEKVFSPILTEGESFIFHLNGKNYKFEDSKIEETQVSNYEFNLVVDCLNTFNKKGDVITLYGENDNILDINLTEGSIKLGDVNLTEVGVKGIREALMSVKFFNVNNMRMLESVCLFAENLDMIVEMDNFMNLSSKEFTGVYLTMIAVEEGVWLNKVNPAMKLNEMKFFKSATEAVNETKEFIGYDATNYLSERLIKEGNEAAKAQKKRSIINEEIEFLEEKKAQIEKSIKENGNSEKLKEALNIINEELTNKEKELQSTYISEKKTIKDYLDDGYVEATLKKSVQTLKKGTNILINAEDYSSLGSDDLIDIIDVKTSKSFLVPKGDISISFD